MFLPVFIIALDDRTFRYILRKHDTFVVICKTGKDLIRTAIQQADKGNPFFAVVLEFNNVSIQFTRTGSYDNRRFHAIAIVFLALLLSRQQYT